MREFIIGGLLFVAAFGTAYGAVSLTVHQFGNEQPYEPPIIGHLVETEKGVEAICYIYDDRIFLGCENQ